MAMGSKQVKQDLKDRRQVLSGGLATGLTTSLGLGVTSKSAAQSFDYPVKNPPMPNVKPISKPAINARWTRLADMPFPVQEIYPSAFWTQSVANAQPTKALRAQRFNIIVNAGGIIGQRAGRFATTREVSVYEPISDRWTSGPDLPDPCHHVQLVAHNGYLYALGGFTTQDRRDQPPNLGWRMRRSVLRLDSIDGRWEHVAELPAPQAEAVCVSLNGFIHVAGGRSPVGSMNSQWSDHIDTDRHFALDTRRNEWFELTSMNVARNSTAGAAVGGVLYVIGGRKVNGGNVAVNEAYDPLSDRWQEMRPMPQAQAGLAAATIGDTIFVFGGEYFNDGGGVYAQSWAYDTREDRWRRANPMPRPRHGLGAVSMNNAVYVMGGASSPGGIGTSAVLDRFML